MKVINENEYKELVLNGSGVVVLDFYASWCGPCRMLAPILEEVEEETSVTVYKMDVDECASVPREYGVMSIPTVCIFKDGKFQEKFIGFKQKEEIIDILSKY